MKSEYESPIFEFVRIIFGEDILTASSTYPTDPEVTASGGSDNFDDSDPFGGW